MSSTAASKRYRDEMGMEQGKHGRFHNPERKGNYIYTFTGKRFYPLDPRVEDFDIEDIAHSLANSCRFTGHVRKFYSVAEHAVRMSNEALKEGLGADEAFVALMHDASEAYLVDVPRPIKAEPYFGALYKKYEEAIMVEAAAAYGFAWPMSEAIHTLDKRMLNTEQRDLMPPAANTGPWFPEAGIVKAKINPWSPAKAEAAFLEAFSDFN